MRLLLSVRLSESLKTHYCENQSSCHSKNVKKIKHQKLPCSATLSSNWSVIGMWEGCHFFILKAAFAVAELFFELAKCLNE